MPVAETDSVAEAPAVIAVECGCVWMTGSLHADCATVTVCPAIVIVALRDVPVFASTLNATVAEPVPVVPDVMWIQGAGEFADHGQLAVVVTVIVPVPPVTSKLNAAGATE